MQTKHSFKYWQWRVIICSMVGYAVYYFVRKNFAFAMPSLGEEYGITNTSFGIILSLVGIIYGLSKFVNGIIADRTVARWHLAIGLAACSVFNLVFGWSDKLSTLITGQTGGAEFVSTMVIIMATLLVLNNVFQGCGFPLAFHHRPPVHQHTDHRWRYQNRLHLLPSGFPPLGCQIRRLVMVPLPLHEALGSRE